MKSPKRRAWGKKRQNLDELTFLQTPRPSVIVCAKEYIPHYKVLPYFLYLRKRFLLFTQMDNPR